MRTGSSLQRLFVASAALLLSGAAGCAAGGTGSQTGSGGSVGTGGDGSFYSTGVFFEGAITSGCADGNTVDDAIQANIVAAGYGK